MSKPSRAPLKLVASNPPQAGGTSVRECPEIAAQFGLQNVWVKDESENPYGTHKDRKSEYIVTRLVLAHKTRRRERLCIFTSGNAGLSLARFARPYGLGVVAIVDKDIDSLTFDHLKAECLKVKAVAAQVRRYSEEDLRLLAGESQGIRVVDATNRIESYKSIVDEIAPVRPDVLVVPVGGGELFLGIHRRLTELEWPTRMIGVTVTHWPTHADKLYASWAPFRGEVRDLCGEASRHKLLELQDERGLEQTTRSLSKRLRCEASSAAAFEALRLLPFAPEERVMVVNTGTFNRGRELRESSR